MAVIYNEPPQQWRFNDGDRAQFASRFWKCPVRLVESRQWATMWRAPGTVRGGGMATSILPILAVHAYELSPGGQWTEWHKLSHRRIATLAGINKESVSTAFQHLEAHGVLERRKVVPKRGVGGMPEQQYRLSRQLFPDAEERFVQIGANLFYGGTWSLLPSAAARHMYVALAALDPVIHEEGLYWKLYENDSDKEQDELLAEFRSKHPISIADMEMASGLQRSTVIEALAYLTHPIFDRGKLPLIRTGVATDGHRRWYALAAAAQGWNWLVEAPDGSYAINDPKRFAEVRLSTWPQFAAAQKQRQAKAATRKRKKRKVRLIR